MLQVAVLTHCRDITCVPSLCRGVECLFYSLADSALSVGWTPGLASYKQQLQLQGLFHDGFQQDDLVHLLQRTMRTHLVGTCMHSQHGANRAGYQDSSQSRVW